ncbi:MAG: DUF1549 and DUF1553 domain-containing protein, partial [Gemmataceae bacterium]|nr:DUF1549 and DUF1553 domain-containing protein [Gemmataceae bacterium]
VAPAAPDESLLLRKASGRAAHGGGTRLPAGHEDYQTLRAWVAAGMPVGAPDAPKVIALRVEPAERVMAPKAEQRLKVLARYTDGSERDVTRHARFQSNTESVAGVSAGGVVATSDTPGEAAVMAAYLGEVAVSRVVVPRPGPPAKNGLPQFNLVDRLVDAKLAKLNVGPSDACDDADFLRRAYLDLAGTLPAPDAARRFLGDPAKDKRAALVAALLGTSEHADLWSLRWADLLRVDRQALGHQQAHRYYQWIRDAVRENTPFDAFARELVTAEGPAAEVGPANFFKVVTKPGELAGTVSQVFLGVRIACAECHHHPFDRWKQSDYYGMSAFFTAGGTTHPRTKKEVFAHALGSEMPGANPPGDRRLVLADWMTRPDNPFFARNLANRVWAWMLGRGLVEPVDDVRATNPPTNPELLAALAADFRQQKFDLKKLLRTILTSQVYQLSAMPNERNAWDS